jgi:predicted RNA-binding protein with RPS1 domain
MDATIRISLSELTPDFITDLKKIFREDQKLELTIEPVNDFGLNIKETKEAYFNRINQVLKNLEERRSVSFSENEFDEFVKNLEK